jgi:hypothetical protein
VAYATLDEAQAFSLKIAEKRLQGNVEVPPVACPHCHQDPKERMVTIGNGDRPIVRRVAINKKLLCKSCAFREAYREERDKGRALTDEEFEKQLSPYKGKGVLGLYIYRAAPASSS